MSEHTIAIYLGKKKNYVMVIKISKYPLVIYSEITLDEIIKFIGSHDEYIEVTAYVNEKVYSILKSKIINSKIILKLGVS